MPASELGKLETWEDPRHHLSLSPKNDVLWMFASWQLLEWVDCITVHHPNPYKYSSSLARFLAICGNNAGDLRTLGLTAGPAGQDRTLSSTAQTRPSGRGAPCDRKSRTRKVKPAEMDPAMKTKMEPQECLHLLLMHYTRG